VRRIRQPGCKFDHILTLEGPEGKGKSTAIAVLAGVENFSDQTILSQSDKEQQELLRGIWLYEIADLAGLRRAEAEPMTEHDLLMVGVGSTPRVAVFLSPRRMRMSISSPRQAIAGSGRLLWAQ